MTTQPNELRALLATLTHLDEYLVEAASLDALTAEEQQLVEVHCAACEECASLVERRRGHDDGAIGRLRLGDRSYPIRAEPADAGEARETAVLRGRVDGLVLVDLDLYRDKSSPDALVVLALNGHVVSLRALGLVDLRPPARPMSMAARSSRAGPAGAAETGFSRSRVAAGEDAKRPPARAPVPVYRGEVGDTVVTFTSLGGTVHVELGNR